MHEGLCYVSAFVLIKLNFVLVLVYFALNELGFGIFCNIEEYF